MKGLTKVDKDGRDDVSRLSVRNTEWHSNGSEGEHIVKWSHSLANRISESDIIISSRRVLRRADKSRKLEKFLPKVLYTKDIDRRIMQFREMLSSEYKEKRILRFIIIENLEPLYSIDNLGNFKSAVIDIVLGIFVFLIHRKTIILIIYK